MKWSPRTARFLGAFVVVLLVALGTAWAFHFKLTPRVLTPEEAAPELATTMRFEVVTTEAAQERGLGGRASIPDNYGMLFVFAQPTREGFWMKDMLVPIDIIWLTKDGSIVHIDNSLATSTYPNVFYPPVPVPYVLETRAGYAQAHSWSVGTHVALPTPYGS